MAVKFYILSLKEMAKYGEPRGDLAWCYSYENCGFGCLRPVAAKGTAVAKKLVQLQTELLEVQSIVNGGDSPTTFYRG